MAAPFQKLARRYGVTGIFYNLESKKSMKKP
jgi:hypothetical protein